MKNSKKKNIKKKSRKTYKKKQQKGGLEKMKAYVINLDKNVERWKTIQDNFKDKDIVLERFKAIENKNGHEGLAKSYQSLVKMAKENNLETILIMEDDCKPLKYFNKRWNFIKEWLINNKDKWEIFNGGVRAPQNMVLKYELNMKIKLYNASLATYAHFIFINSNAYDKILNWKESDGLFDLYINTINNFNTLIIDPPLALQNSGYSNTDKGFKNYNKNSEQINKIKEIDALLLEGGNTKLVINNTKNGAGLFSEFNKMLTYLLDNPETTEIEFNVRATSPGGGLPFIKENEELFSKLFEPYNENKSIDKNVIAEQFYKMEYTFSGAFNFYNENRIKLKPLADVFNKYIKIKQNILDKVNAKYNELRKDTDLLVGILVRSNALASEQPDGKMPTREEYLAAVNNLDKTKRKKYFIRSDNDEDLEFYKEHLQPNYYTNMKRSSNNKADAMHRSSNEYMTLQDLEDIFSEIVLLSKCDILIHCVSNMATASLIMNMNQQSICIS
jgi:hypothetical protein